MPAIMPVSAGAPLTAPPRAAVQADGEELFAAALQAITAPVTARTPDSSAPPEDDDDLAGGPQVGGDEVPGQAGGAAPGEGAPQGVVTLPAATDVVPALLKADAAWSGAAPAVSGPIPDDKQGTEPQVFQPARGFAASFLPRTDPTPPDPVLPPAWQAEAGPGQGAGANALPGAVITARVPSTLPQRGQGKDASDGESGTADAEAAAGNAAKPELSEPATAGGHASRPGQGGASTAEPRPAGTPDAVSLTVGRPASSEPDGNPSQMAGASTAAPGPAARERRTIETGTPPAFATSLPEQRPSQAKGLGGARGALGEAGAPRAAAPTHATRAQTTASDGAGPPRAAEATRLGPARPESVRPVRPTAADAPPVATVGPAQASAVGTTSGGRADTPSGEAADPVRTVAPTSLMERERSAGDSGGRTIGAVDRVATSEGAPPLWSGARPDAEATTIAALAAGGPFAKVAPPAAGRRQRDDSLPELPSTGQPGGDPAGKPIAAAAATALTASTPAAEAREADWPATTPATRPDNVGGVPAPTVPSAAPAQAGITTPLLRERDAANPLAPVSTSADEPGAETAGGGPVPDAASPAVPPPDLRPQSTPRAVAEPARMPQSPLPEITMRDGVAEARIEPDELGGIDIRVSREEGGLSLTIRAERPESAALMRRHADLLHRELAEGGVGKARIDFGGATPATPGAAPVHAGIAPAPDPALPGGGSASTGAGQTGGQPGQSGGQASNHPGSNPGGQPRNNAHSNASPAGIAGTGPAAPSAPGRAATAHSAALRGIDIRF